MKKFILILCCMFVSMGAFSQSKKAYPGYAYTYATNTHKEINLGEKDLGSFLGLGGSAFRSNDRALGGINLSISVNRIYFGFSTSIVLEKNDYLDFSSSSSYRTDKSSVGGIDFGFILPTKDINFIPTFGVAWSSEIWEDPILFTTWFKSGTEILPKIGIVCAAKLPSNNQVYLGFGNVEFLKFGFNIHIQ